LVSAGGGVLPITTWQCPRQFFSLDALEGVTFRTAFCPHEYCKQHRHGEKNQMVKNGVVEMDFD
jgi:hypothetical protein